MTTFGDMAFAMGGVPLLPSIPFGRASKAFFCAPGTDSGGSDGNRGTNVKQPLATLSKAQTLATADHNDTVFMIASSNTAANTTDYQSSALAWAKDGVHLIGVNSGNQVAQRSRIAQLSTATNVDDLFTVGADNCLIGLDTLARGTAATYEMVLSGGATRNTFRNCIILSYAEAAGMSFVNIPATGIDRWVLFENCWFINPIQSAATTMTEAFAVATGTSPNGLVMVRNCTLIGATDWEAATVAGRFYSDGAAPPAATSGLAVAVAAS